MSQRDERDELTQQRKDLDERNRADKVHRDSTTREEGKPDEQESNLRRGGVSGGKVDPAVTAQQRQDELNKNPRPLLHVDPSTGIPISKPFSPSGAATAEPNQLTQPGRPENATVAGNDPARNAQAQAILNKGKP